MHRLLDDQRGQVLVLAALLFPVFILMCAFVVDVGNWYAHKRQLQNKADAGALAAGYEYISRLSNCAASPGVNANAITAVAKQYAGQGYNTTLNNPGSLIVKVNATGPLAADWSDGPLGQGPCEKHADADLISPAGAVWTDVRVRETNIGSLFGGFGLDLDHVDARARVEVKQIVGLWKGGLPIVTETGQTIECVWARFVRARDGSTNGFTVTPSNPIPLTGGPYTWTANVTNLQFTNAHDDIAIQYWAGSKNGSAPCVYNENGNQRPLPHVLGEEKGPVAIDWINVYDTGTAPVANAAPKLRRFALTSDTRGGPGFLYPTSTSPFEACRVAFQAEIDTGPNAVRGTITVNPHGTGVDPVTVPFDNTAGGGVKTTSGTILVYPNEVSGAPNISQDYTQVGRTWFSVSWRQTTGQVGSGGNSNCASGGSNCNGTFQGETVSGVSSFVQHMTYTDDPLSSTPLTATSKSLATTSFPASGSTGAFTLSFSHTGVDQEGIVIMRDSVQSSGNRTNAIWCGGASNGAKEIEEAFVGGCPVPLKINARADSCTTPPGGWPEEPSKTPLDCVQLEQGNKTGPVGDGIQQRFGCADNNWVSGGPLPPEGDPRYAYVVLTGFGRIIPAPNNGFLPIEGFVKIYATGWGGKGFGAACSENDPPPRGFDSKGAQIWGHLVDVVTTSSDVMVGNDVCNATAAIVTCKPVLVR